MNFILWHCIKLIFETIKVGLAHTNYNGALIISLAFCGEMCTFGSLQLLSASISVSTAAAHVLTVIENIFEETVQVDVKSYVIVRNDMVKLHIGFWSCLLFTHYILARAIVDSCICVRACAPRIPFLELSQMEANWKRDEINTLKNNNGKKRRKKTGSERAACARTVIVSSHFWKSALVSFHSIRDLFGIAFLFHLFLLFVCALCSYFWIRFCSPVLFLCFGFVLCNI